MTKTTTKTAAAASKSSTEKPTREELLAKVSGLAMQTVEIVGGKSFPIGKTFDCIKAGVSRFGKPYIVLSVDGVDKFCDPANVKPLKALAPAKAAAAKAALEEAREATLIVGGLVKNESERAVLIGHHGWYKPRWFPKTLISVLGDHEDGEQKLFEVPRWKIGADHGPKGIEELTALQSGYEAMLEPKAPPAPETTVIKKGSAAAKAARRTVK